MAQPEPAPIAPAPPPEAAPAAWQTALGWTAAALLALLFLASGLWKITDAPGAAVRMAQALVPQSLSLAAAILFGIAETFGAVLLVTPRFRRWGAMLTGLLLIAFLLYFAIFYNALRGADCSCFPWIKRIVGPMFFWSDGAMLLLAMAAWRWSRPPSGLKTALLILATIAVFAVATYAIGEARQTGTRAPETITVDGRPMSVQSGKILLFYFDPECMHCFDAARRMSKMNWGATKVIAVPVQNPQFAAQFLQDTGLRALVSTDVAALRKIFPFTSAPAGVALVNGREKAALTQFDENQPGADLKRLGFVE
jgi:uncharacterized membrane protein YphA (DoxX/SURF4 family)